MLGILAGTSLLHSNLFRDFRPKLYRTDYGSVELYLTPQDSDLSDVAFCQRHDRDGEFAPPHLINHHANLQALGQAGVTHVVGIYSVGSLKDTHPPGSLVIADDYLNPWDPLTYNEGQPDGKFITPTLDPDLRRQIGNALLTADLPLDPRLTGTYVQTRGPRFETKAEVRMLAQYGDVVGMTGAKEADLAQELDLPFAMVCMVDNYAHGVSGATLTVEQFKEMVEQNRGTMERIVRTLIDSLSGGDASME